MRSITLLLALSLTGPALAKVTPPPAKIRAALKLDPFYKKHINVDGFSVVASAKVSDFALEEAAYLIQKMVGKRADILRALEHNRTRFVVMAHNEFTTDVPEHRDLQPRLYWNKRARGLGATPERPVVSCGEENLLCFKGDPYASENILVHEFAHAIHQVAMANLDPTFDERLEAIYDAAMADGLWKGKYAARNRMEYWAEGVQSWFDTNRENDFEHNHVNTRAELKKYDPRLAKLITEIFGENNWRYTRPADRDPPSPHLKGFNPATAPIFTWPRDLTRWYARFRKGLETLAPKDAIELELLSPQSANWRSPRTSHETHIFIANASRRSVRLEWIDYAGKPKPYSADLRPTDQLSQQTYAGHVWRLVDNQTGEALHYFIATKAPGKIVLKEMKKAGPGSPKHKK